VSPGSKPFVSPDAAPLLADDTAPASAAPFSFAFQPIVDIKSRLVYSYEALVRGTANQSAWQILSPLTPHGLFAFDQAARIQAIELAMRLGITCRLNLNFMPHSVGSSPEAILSTLQAANRFNLPINRMVIEVVEGEIIEDPTHFAAFINQYRRLGLQFAIDDFGSGYSGLNLLADFQPDQVKLDMKLIRDIECNGPRQAIVRAISQICFDLGIDVIAEGIETVAEYEWLSSQGIQLFQGYLFAKPAFEEFPPVHYPNL
jgi:EAL domain-containing protein (putative c-di-GMP-specific phosphodiesterase class I)